MCSVPISLAHSSKKLTNGKKMVFRNVNMKAKDILLYEAN